MIDNQSVDTKVIPPSERLHPVEKKLVKDFYLSFKFSQGDATLQEALMEFLLLSYTSEERNSIHNSRISLENAITALKTPKTHTFIRQVVQEEEFGKQWENFRAVANRIHGQQHPDTESIIKPIVEAIAKEMLYKDKNWVTRGRENRAQYKEDRFESYIRTYAFQQTDTGSPHFNELFSRLGTVYHDALTAGASGKTLGELSPIHQNLLPGLHQLQTAWERHHPQQSFIPEGR